MVLCEKKVINEFQHPITVTTLSSKYKNTIHKVQISLTSQAPIYFVLENMAGQPPRGSPMHPQQLPQQQQLPADVTALRKVFTTVQSKIRDILQSAEPTGEDEDESSAKRQKLKLQQDAKEIVNLMVELEEVVAGPPSEASVQLEIARLEQELNEKNQLLRNIQTKVDNWAKETTPIEETD